ncbi:hypothetical protein [Chitinophaga sp.]|uniref:hypothetical protein n=1 Tax=Chitinophaga sp. TaxID=1869181 RepID=UPI002F9422A7
MQRTYAVLKYLLAFFCMLTGVIIIISVISVLSLGTLSELEGVGEWVGTIIAFLLCLGPAFLLLRFGYRLFKEMQKSGILARKNPLSPEKRKSLAILYLVLGVVLTIAIIVNGLNGPGVSAGSPEFMRGWVLGYWLSELLMFAGSIYLIKIGYTLWKPVKEKIELLGEEF